MRPFAQRGRTLLDFIVEKEPNNHLERSAEADFKYPDIFQQLDEWEQHYGAEPEPFAKETYDGAVDYIRLLYRRRAAAASRPTSSGSLLRPDRITTPQFLMFIEGGRPRAYVVLACYCAMTLAVDDLWIFHGMAQREVRGGIQGRCCRRSGTGPWNGRCR